MTASASAIVGSSRGWANETASIRRAPASARRVISSTLAPVGRIVASFCSPSRGLTSTIVIPSMTVLDLRPQVAQPGRRPHGGGQLDERAPVPVGEAARVVGQGLPAVGEGGAGQVEPGGEELGAEEAAEDAADLLDREEVVVARAGEHRGAGRAAQ